MIVQLKTKGMTRLASRVSVFKWKTWKARTLETCCVTLKYCLYLYLLPLLFIHTKTIYKYSYFLHICIYIYIYILYILYIYICMYIYIYMYLFIWYMITDMEVFCILRFWNECSTLVLFCPFIRHPISKFTLRPWLNKWR